MSDAPSPVRRRHVFYIPGHDPAGGRRYREIYRTEAAKQAAVSGYSIEVAGLPAEDGIYRWAVTADIDGQHTETVVDFLLWNDLVRDSLSKSLPATFWLTLRTLWVYLSSGALRAIWRVRPVMLFTTLYPFAVYLLTPVAGLLLGVFAAWALGLFLTLPGWAWLPAGMLGVAAALLIFQHYDRRFFVSYLVRAYAYMSARHGGEPPGLKDRADRWQAHLRAALASDVDEVLIVGHSAGAGIGVYLCARALEAGTVPEGKLALLGIGSVTQMVSFLPRARWMRADLRRLAATPHLAWVEVTAPSDGLCFAMADPVATTGVDPAPEDKHWPLVFSAAFHHSLSDAYRESPEFTQFRRHFQYIYHFDKPRDYDYFQITAGPLRLSDRYAGRDHSPSRVARPVGPYRDY